MYLRHFFCPQCQSRYSPTELNQRCSKCFSSLLSRYDYSGIASSLTREDLRTRSQSIWRYKEFLPVHDEANIVSMNEGMSPVIPLHRLEKVLQVSELFIKDDSRLPCNSFKSRVASVTVSKAVELGASTIIACTGPVEGLVWALYTRRAGLGLVLLIHKNGLPENYKNAILATGASLVEYTEPHAVAEALAERTATAYGWLHASIYYEPYRYEGKKTIGFEIAEQFEWNLPDVIIVPAMGGGTLAAIYKAFRELQSVGWLPVQLPRLVAVQPAALAPIVKAFEGKKRMAPIPEQGCDLNFDENVEFDQQSSYIAMDGIYKTLGSAVAVTTEEASAAAGLAASREGIITEERGQLALAAAIKLSHSGWLKKSDRVLVYQPENTLITGPLAHENTASSLSFENLDVLPQTLGAGLV